MKLCPVCNGTMHELGGILKCDFCHYEERVKPVTSFYENVAEALY